MLLHELHLWLNNMIFGVLPCNPIPNETMTWDIEHVLDIEICIANANRGKQTSPSRYYLMTKIIMLGWTSGNTSTALWKFKMEPIALACKLCSVIRNCWGWPLGTTHAFVPKRLGRQKQQSCGPSMKTGVRGDVNPLSSKSKWCKLELRPPHTLGYKL